MPTKPLKAAKARKPLLEKPKSKPKKSGSSKEASRKAVAKSVKAAIPKSATRKPKGTDVAGAKKSVSAKVKVAPSKMKAVSKKSPKSDIASKKPQPKVVAKIVKGKKTGTQASKGKAVGKKAYELPELLREAALKVLDERKAEDIVCIDLRGRSSLADYAMIASGTSARQLGAIANYLLEAFGKLGVKGVRVEGLPQGDWVLIDAGDILIHMFRPEVRTYYQIEDIWSETTG